MRGAAATGALSAEELRKIDAYWRAANYLSVGQIYLYANALLKEPLRLTHIKPRLLRSESGNGPENSAGTETAVAIQFVQLQQ